MNYYKIQYASCNTGLPVLKGCNVHIVQATETFKGKQNVFVQTASGLTPAVVEGQATAEEVHEASWLPRAYSQYAEKAKQKKEAGL